jgi:hypothetical protein
MEILIWLNFVLNCVILVILIGLAGTVAKMLQYWAREGEQEEVMPSRDGQLLDLPSGQLYRDENGQLVETGQATYPDPSVLAGGEPHADGVTDRPSTTNWDGIPT